MTNYTDEELNRDWQPSGRRPQSTIARSFSQELSDLFRIENSVADLDSQVDKRKRIVSLQTEELEALQARLREIQNLEACIRGDAEPLSAGSSSSSSPTVASQQEAHQQKQAQAQAHRDGMSLPFTTSSATSPAIHAAASTSPANFSHKVVVDGHQKQRLSTAGSAMRAPSAGNMPPSPIASDGGYY
ncbi:hypothetical protein HOO65_010587 [Ceratocystis lukuohia]|uniref:Uncharacterized protein n=2 Tax=Ceratocystis TaxID=5157 RepID=A0A0F8B3I1_CERFI|nr:hypothetical protein CFO_g3070 [Ceratocystis platani]